MTENVALAARMTELGIGATELARALEISERTVGYWLSGTITWPNEPTRSKLIKLLKVNNARDLGFIRRNQRYLGRSTYDTAIVPFGDDWTSEAATDRRDALRAGGMAVAGTVAGLVTHQALSEPDHMAAALDAGSVSPDRLTDLERTTDSLSRRLSTPARSTLLGEALSTFGTVRRLVRERQRTADQVRLIRIGSKLALIAGELLFDRHQFPLTERWYRTARSAALDIGDQHLADKALAAQSNVPAYSGDPWGVLDLVGPRLEASPGPSSAAAFLWSASARAHAALGDRVAFQRATDKSRTMLEATPDSPNTPNVFAFPTKRLAFYETTGFVKLRDSAGAITAGDRALALYTSSPVPSMTEATMVRLDQASAFALAGELDEACRRATAVLTDKRAYPAASVLIRAAEFDTLLGDDPSPTIRDWREVLHSARQRRTTAPHI
ncbi:MAG TPA: helix-turn-helix transcriptional regulator [Pseudonocardiaceae bacterium]|nr:helix-turn-helix transcriptional regulator [Pseudonocardiaceae bacterium]